MKDRLKLSKEDKRDLAEILGKAMALAIVFVIGWGIFMGVAKLVCFCLSVTIGVLPLTGVYIALVFISSFFR